MYNYLCPCYEVYSERQKNKKNKTRAAEMARYPNDLSFDGDVRVRGRRGAGGVYILRREEASSMRVP